MFQFKNVTSLNIFIKAHIRQSKELSDIELTAEISQYTLYRGKTAYFAVKDDKSVINCVMFEDGVRLLDFVPDVGDKVKLQGRIDYYDAQGKVQFYVSSMTRAGAGDLYEQYLKLFAKLSNEGLFDPAHKKKIPLLPRRIGLITSPSGKVKSDVINTMRKKNTHFDIVLYPASVQGTNCAPEVCEGIDYFMSTRIVDVIIIARGGGSYDELFCFNDERIARKVYDCDIPVIVAIGHDEDKFILNYVADCYCGMPAEAGNTVICSYNDQINDVNNLLMRLDMSMRMILDSKRARLDSLRNHKALYSTRTYFDNQMVSVKQLTGQMGDCLNRKISDDKKDLSSLISRLETLNPSNVLKRGYSYVSDKDGNAIESISKINTGDKISVVFADGVADATVTDTNITEDK